MSKGVTFKKMDGSGLKIGIVYTRWNNEISDALFEKSKQALLDSGVEENNIIVSDVPGAYELPFGVQDIIKKEEVDAVVCLGALIKGETMHFEYIAEAVTHGVMRVQLDSGVPVVFGVLMCLTGEQAVARSSGSESFAYEWGLSAVEMGLLKRN